MDNSLKEWLFDPNVGKLISAILVLVAVIAIVRFIQGVIGKHVNSSENRYRVRKFVGLSGYILGAFALTIVFSNELSGLTVFFGFAAGGIAFALQEVISSIAGWMTLSFGNIYQIGDRVQLGGIKGDVIDIGILRTTLMECGAWVNGDLYNGRVVRVANSFIFKEPVYNYSSDFPFLWDEIIVPIKYGSNYVLARQTFQEVLDDITGAYVLDLKQDWRKMTTKYLLENARLEPMISLTLKDSWAEFTLRYVVNYKQRRSIKDQISGRLLKAIDNSQGQILLGASSIEITAAPTLDITLNK